MISAYPRPQFRRDSYFCLNGTWEFAVSASDTIPAKFPESICVPYPPEAPLSGIGRRIGQDETMFYRRTFSLPENFSKGRILLHFGAVDQKCEVFLNGRSIGTHEGGYLPFTFDITDQLLMENVLIVQAKDPLDHAYPWGKQRVKNGGMWYTPFSGIWQTVWIESVPRSYLRSLRITPALDRIRLELFPNEPSVRAETELTVETPDGPLHWTFSESVVTVPIPNPILWTPENPHLYRITIRYGEDVVAGYFALRTLSIGTVDGIPRILLNGKPYFFHGLLDQGYWQDGLCLPPDDDGYERDVRYAKSLGFNMLRKHIRIEPLPFYEACDRLGMIVFQDFVNNGPYRYLRDTVLPTIGFVKANDLRRRLTDRTKTIFKNTLAGTVHHLYNCPCIAYWTIFNEGWGQLNSDGMYALLQSLDETRIIDSTSGWFWQSESDVDSYHLYFKPLTQFGGKRPLVLSEFGGYSHSGNGKQYGYKFFETKEAYRSAIISLYESNIIPAVKKGLCAAVYTQLSDIEEEQNGLISYDRSEQKVDAARMRLLAQKLRIEPYE